MGFRGGGSRGQSVMVFGFVPGLGGKRIRKKIHLAHVNLLAVPAFYV